MPLTAIIFLLFFPGTGGLHRFPDLSGVDQGHGRGLLLQELCLPDAACGHGSRLHHQGAGPPLLGRTLPGQDEPARVVQPRAMCPLLTRVSMSPVGPLFPLVNLPHCTVISGLIHQYFHEKECSSKYGIWRDAKTLVARIARNPWKMCMWGFKNIIVCKNGWWIRHIVSLGPPCCAGTLPEWIFFE